MRRLVAGVLFMSLAACVTETDREDGRFENDPTANREADVIAAEPAQPTPGDDAADDTADERTPDPDEKTPVTPKTQTTCAAPRDLGVVAGDADGASVSTQGTCSEWLRIRVNETATSSLLAGPMKLSATLVSPAAADYDLYLYVNKDADVVECTKEEGKSDLPANRSDILKLQWGEGWTANASDDQRPVSIEVRAKDPANCGKGNWVLLLEGNR